MSQIDIDNPQFTAAIRGYDKLQVDDYIERLQGYAEEAEERARAAETAVEFTGHANVGPRVSEIFELATTEAKEMRESAKADADRIRAEARRKAEEIIARAENEEASVRERSDREAEEAHAAIDAQRHRAELAIAQLQDTKDALLGDLRQIHTTLAKAAGLSEEEAAADEAAAEQPEVEPPVDDEATIEHEVAEPPPAPRSNAA